MEISFISEVGKKNVPETSSKTSLEEKRAFREQAQHGPRDSAQKQICTIVFVRTNDAGTPISKVSIWRWEILLLSARGLGRSLGGCVYVCVSVCVCARSACFLEVFLTRHGWWGPGLSALKCHFQSLLWSSEIKISAWKVCFLQFPKHKTHLDISARHVTQEARKR